MNHFYRGICEFLRFYRKWKNLCFSNLKEGELRHKQMQILRDLYDFCHIQNSNEKDVKDIPIEIRCEILRTLVTFKYSEKSSSNLRFNSNTMAIDPSILDKSLELLRKRALESIFHQFLRFSRT